jgi:ppGpp synthetase/RelA/SpoT-type nucleotidyltranferase
MQRIRDDIRWQDSIGMKKDIPKEFVEEYERRYGEFVKTLEACVQMLKLRLGQLGGRTGVRGKVVDARVKRAAKTWEKAVRQNLSGHKALTEIVDLLGIRIVCNNLSDVAPIIDMISSDWGIFGAPEVRKVKGGPESGGYVATHVRTRIMPGVFGNNEGIPCEIQVRTLAQDAWAHLLRADIYGKNVPERIKGIVEGLSRQLQTVDEIAQQVRDELNRCPAKASELHDNDTITPERLALLYENRFGDDIWEWSLIDWVECLAGAEAKTMGDAGALLDDKSMRKKLNEKARRIRMYEMTDSEWAVCSALVASEVSVDQGIRAVEERIRAEWDEIVRIAKGEEGGEMPATLEEFIEMLKEGHLPLLAAKELGVVQNCFRCGAEIVCPETGAEAVMNYYGNPETTIDLCELLEQLDGVGGFQVESVDFSGACQYCGHQIGEG